LQTEQGVPRAELTAGGLESEVVDDLSFNSSLNLVDTSTERSTKNADLALDVQLECDHSIRVDSLQRFSKASLKTRIIPSFLV